MTEMPTLVKVGPFRYRVDCSRAAINEVKADTKKDAAGGCNHDTLVIAVDPDSPHDQKADTLLHEALHAVWYVTACPKKADEETVIEHLSSVLLGVLRDNPALVTYLIAEDAP